MKVPTETPSVASLTVHHPDTGAEVTIKVRKPKPRDLRLINQFVAQNPDVGNVAITFKTIQQLATINGETLSLDFLDEMDMEEFFDLQDEVEKVMTFRNREQES